METVYLAVAIITEVALVLLLYVFYLQRRLIKVRQQIEMTQTETADSDHYLSYLQKEIQNTNHKFSTVENDTALAAMKSIVELRLNFLTAEKQAYSAAGSEGLDQNALWDAWSSAMQTEEVVDTEGVAVESEQIELKDQEIALLKQRLESYLQRVENLEKFKDLFLDMKQQLESTQKLHEGILQEVDKHVPVEDRSDDLQELLVQLAEENENLQEKLDQVRREFETMISDLDIDVPVKSSDISEMPGKISEGIQASMDEISRNVLNFRNVIASQKEKISELNVEVDGLRGELSSSDRLQWLVGMLQQKNDELLTATASLEEENEFLSDQIQMLLRKELENEKELKDKLATFSQSLIQKDVAYAQLESKFASMESQYLELMDESKTDKEV